ncbi:MAG: glycosyltransferase family 2 protein [Gaiellaceae bacterium]
MSRCAIVVPAYREASTIGAVVRALSSHAPVIVVDDASADGTAEAAAAAGATVVSHAANVGYGAAVASGMARAAADGFTHVVTADGDGQHDSDEVGEFVRLVGEDGWEFAVGIRPGPYRPVERLCALYARRALGVRDPLCGVKAYDLRFHAAYGGFDLRRSVGTELMTYAIRHGARWTQRPITLRARDHGASRFYGSLRANLRIFRSLAALVLVR